jgi:hypothetical protein
MSELRKRRDVEPARAFQDLDPLEELGHHREGRRHAIEPAIGAVVRLLNGFVIVGRYGTLAPEQARKQAKAILRMP